MVNKAQKKLPKIFEPEYIYYRAVLKVFNTKMIKRMLQRTF